MRILYIWHAAVEKSYRKLFSGLSANNTVVLCTVHRWFESSRDQAFVYNSETDKNIKVYKFFAIFRNHIRSFFYLNIFKMVYILLFFKPEIIYLREEPFSLNAFQWVFISKIFARRSRIVVESDENLVIRHPFVFRLIERFVFKKVNGIACVPQKGMELYKSKGYKGKIFKTFYFYDEEIFMQFSRKEAFLKLNIPINKGVYFGYAGRLTEEKGIEDLLRAFLILLKENEDCYLLITGKGKSSYENKLFDFVRTNDMQNRVKFLGSLSSEKLVYFYNCLDALVVPSYSTEWWVEQFGRVIIEAMACGVPVIGSSSGEIPFVIDVKDLIFKEKNFKELYKIMKKFVTGEFGKDKFFQKMTDRAKLFSFTEAVKNRLDIMKEVLCG